MRTPLTRDAVVTGAVTVADREGLHRVSMRTVGQELGVAAMSLYHHVTNKEELLDALADWAFEQMDTPALETPWRRAMSERAHSARAVLRAHPWALGLLESRQQPGPAILTHHNAVIGNLRTHGFTIADAAHAFSLLDAYVFGFVLTEVNLPFDDGDRAETFAEGLKEALVDHPYLLEMVNEQVVDKDYTYGQEFEVGLDLILDGLERLVSANTPGKVRKSGRATG